MQGGSQTIDREGGREGAIENIFKLIINLLIYTFFNPLEITYSITEASTVQGVVFAHYANEAIYTLKSRE